MIPVEFDYQGKHYKGHLSEVSGAAAQLWHLMIDNYYYGQLFYTDAGLKFYSQSGKFQELEDYLIEVITAWYE